MNPKERQSAASYHVHFGDAEDILQHSFFSEPEETEEEEEFYTEEEKKKIEINTRLKQALTADDVSMFKHLLVEVPDLTEPCVTANSSDHDHNRPVVYRYLDQPIIHLAAEHGALKILQECLGKPGDSINAVTSDFEATTPLFCAIKAGQLDVVDWLLGNGAFHQPLNVYQDSATYVAVYYNQIEILDVLKKHGCDCNMPNQSGDLPLMCVVRTCNIKALDKLIESGVDIHALDSSGNPALKLAIQMSGTREVIKKLIEAGFDVNREYGTSLFPVNGACTMLRSAVLYHNLAAIETILPYVDNQKDLNRSVNGAITGSSEVHAVKMLVEAGAKPDIKLAIRRGRRPIFNYLLSSGVSIQNKPTLYWCAYYCTIVTQTFQGTGCTRRKELNLYQIHTEYASFLQDLLDHGAYLDDVHTDTGVSALRHSCASGLVCFTLLLLKVGCNPSLSDITGVTALQYTLQDCCNSYIPQMKRRCLLAIAFILTEYIPYFSREPAVPAILALQEQSEKAAGPIGSPPNGVLPPELTRLLIENSTSPRCLQHLCRVAIVHQLRPNHVKKVEKLGLPPRLQKYVLLEDLVELNRHLAEKMKPRTEDYCFYHQSIERVVEQEQGLQLCACDPLGLLFLCKSV